AGGAATSGSSVSLWGQALALLGGGKPRAYASAWRSAPRVAGAETRGGFDEGAMSCPEPVCVATVTEARAPRRDRGQHRRIKQAFREDRFLTGLCGRSHTQGLGRRARLGLGRIWSVRIRFVSRRCQSRPGLPIATSDFLACRSIDQSNGKG